MTSNLLSLNRPQTEFMLIGLPQQISIISNPFLFLPLNHPITPADSASNLSFIFDSSLSFCKHISSLLNACNYHIRALRRIRRTLDRKTASVIATSLLHSKLEYFNSPYIHLPQTQMSRLPLLEPSNWNPKLNKSPLYSNTCTGSKSKSASTTKSSLVFTTFYIPRNPNTSENFSKLNLLAPLVLPIFLLYSALLHLLLTCLIVHTTKPLLSSGIIYQNLIIFSNTLPNSTTTSQCSSLPLSLSKTHFHSHLIFHSHLNISPQYFTLTSKHTYSKSHTHFNLLPCSD